MGNMKFDGADVTFELDGYDALVERVRSKKVNCKINPSDLPRLYAGTDTAKPGSLAQTGDRAGLIGETFVIGGTVLVAAGVFLDQKKRREQM